MDAVDPAGVRPAVKNHSFPFGRTRQHPEQRKVRMPTTATTPAPRDTSLSSRGKWLVLLAAFLGWGFDGMEQGIFPLIANPALTELTGGAALKLAPSLNGELKLVRIYDRYLRTSEAVPNYSGSR
jgi:hypothetical protein